MWAVNDWRCWAYSWAASNSNWLTSLFVWLRIVSTRQCFFNLANDVDVTDYDLTTLYGFCCCFIGAGSSPWRCASRATPNVSRMLLLLVWEWTCSGVKQWLAVLCMSTWESSRKFMLHGLRLIPTLWHCATNARHVHTDIFVGFSTNSKSSARVTYESLIGHWKRELAIFANKLSHYRNVAMCETFSGKM